MAGKLPAKLAQKMDILEEGSRKIDRIRSLVEQYAAAREKQAEQFLMMIGRAARDVGRVFLVNGYGTMSDGSNAILMATKRGGDQRSKARMLRELVGSVDGDIGRKKKSILEEAKELARSDAE